MKNELWPGCGNGLCMACGTLVLAEIDGKSARICETWLKLGESCPKDPPEQHLWYKRTCQYCGKRRGWVDREGNFFSTLKEAKAAGFKRWEVSLEP